MKDGRKEIKRILKKNPDVFKNIDMIYTSPFLRALETAEILYDKYPSHSFEMVTLLESQNTAEMFVDNFDVKNNPKICFVGHEPLLTSCVKKLLKSPELKIDLEKGGAIVLEGKTLNQLHLTQILKP